MGRILLGPITMAGSAFQKVENRIDKGALRVVVRDSYRYDHDRYGHTMGLKIIPLRVKYSSARMALF